MSKGGDEGAPRVVREESRTRGLCIHNPGTPAHVSVDGGRGVCVGGGAGQVACLRKMGCVGGGSSIVAAIEVAAAGSTVAAAIEAPAAHCAAKSADLSRLGVLQVEVYVVMTPGRLHM